MKYSQQISISAVFNHSSTLRPYLHHLEKIKHLKSTLQDLLEPPLNNIATVQDLNNNILTLSLPSPAAKHHFRFLKVELLAKLRKLPEWCGLVSIELVIDTEISNTTNNCINNTTMPGKSQKFTAIAPEIKDNFIKLASELQKSCPTLAATLARMAEKPLAYSSSD